MPHLVPRVGPNGYVPSGESEGADPAANIAWLKAKLRGMLPVSEEMLNAIVQRILQAPPVPQPQPPGIPGVNGGAMPPAPQPYPGGMLPLPSSPRG